MEIWEIALSALVGGLIATLISIWYQHTSEKNGRYRARSINKKAGILKKPINS
jgi:hypothetical protein